jgi:hypothetical protein
LAKVLECPRAAAQGSRDGEITLAKVLNEILVFSFVAAFVTGIVVLAAAAFIS